MIERIAPRLLHPESRFFLDYIGGEQSALRAFEYAPNALTAAAEARRSFRFPREELAARLRDYNAKLTNSSLVHASIEALADPTTLCVIGGQQAGFLGGPLFTVYKVVSVLRAAAWLSDRLKARTVPIFWLASEDHDFTEINRARFLNASGDLQTISFEWEGRGRPIEHLPITSQVRTAMDDALALFSENRTTARDLFLPDASDDYAAWHARIWSRLFADSGLVLVEPRTVRAMAGPFFSRALAAAEEITSSLSERVAELRQAGYAAPIDPERAGGLFTFAEGGRRVRIDVPSDHVDLAAGSPEAYSPDALLRPLLVDSLFPTAVNVLGPSEIAYHSLLRPLYRLLGIF